MVTTITSRPNIVQITRGLEAGDRVSLAPPRTSELPEKSPDEEAPEQAPLAPAQKKGPVAPVQKNTLAEARKTVKPG